MLGAEIRKPGLCEVPRGLGAIAGGGFTARQEGVAQVRPALVLRRNGHLRCAREHRGRRRRHSRRRWRRRRSRRSQNLARPRCLVSARVPWRQLLGDAQCASRPARSPPFALLEASGIFVAALRGAAIVLIILRAISVGGREAHERCDRACGFAKMYGRTSEFHIGSDGARCADREGSNAARGFAVAAGRSFPGLLNLYQ
mmetsp:Transcript_121355/g.348722  ORF Transcript_121355/g.348722 Transcript_121355/m.348722 type:complete len:200 (+) Transcript_121355:86-685(+)